MYFFMCVYSKKPNDRKHAARSHARTPPPQKNNKANDKANDTPPIIWVIAAQDPTGGAGLQADLETIASRGGHAVCLPTALTVQDTRRLHELLPLPAAWLRRQARALLSELPAQACKIGVIGKPATVKVIRWVLARLPGVPVVLDPVLQASGGGELASPAVRAALLEDLLPHTTLLTPNRAEALSLSGASDPDRAAAVFLARGARGVLISSVASNDRELWHRLYEGNTRYDFRSTRLVGEYHGSGCTLSAALALELARKYPPHVAVQRALDYSAQTLARAFAPGQGQRIPRRWSG